MKYNSIGHLPMSIVDEYFPELMVSHQYPNDIKRKVEKLIENYCYSELNEQQYFKNCEIYGLGFKRLLNDMREFKLPVTHDFYLKAYSELELDLGYKYIICDEFQDANAPIIKIILSQSGTRLVVGDINQSIYGFRQSLNGFEHQNFTDFNKHYLTNSYRINDDIAGIANRIAVHKKILDPDFQYKHCKGLGTQTDNNICYLSATNYGVFEKILELDGKCVINGTYTWTSIIKDLRDINHVCNGNYHNIEQVKFKNFKSEKHILNWMDKHENYEYGASLKFVKNYKENGINLLHEYSKKKYKGNVYVSNTHQAKGKEWGTVYLADDFINLLDLRDPMTILRMDFEKKERAKEEINILYVASTRAKQELIMSSEVSGFINSFYCSVYGI
jgi:superfamily I DNA/RNA helicase